MKTGINDLAYPALPLDEWEETKKTLHLFMQIIGKIRLSQFPKMNHWWHAPLYISTNGLTTRPIPYNSGIFEIEFDFIRHILEIKTSGGNNKSFPIDNMSVANFYKKVFQSLSSLGIGVNIKPIPYDNVSKEPFETNHFSQYDKEYVSRYWKIMISVASIFEQFRAKYTGKSTPVHLFWHHMDLVVTRFSGEKAPTKSWPTNVEKEAYSHEVISFGFWAGDETVREAAFYAYVYPEPDLLIDQPIDPAAASWTTLPGYTMAFLPYEEARKSQNPDETIMKFLDSVYIAGCKSNGWDYSNFELP